MDGALRPEHDPQSDGRSLFDGGQGEHERLDLFRAVVEHPSGVFDPLAASVAAVAELRFDGDEPVVVDEVEDFVTTWSARLARRVRRGGLAEDPLPGTLLLLRLVFGELGFRATAAPPRDSRELEHDFVIERRRGRPVVLALLALEIGRRAGLPLFAAEIGQRVLIACARPPRAVLFDPARDGGAVSSAERRDLGERSTAGCVRLGPRDLVERYLEELKQAQVREGDIAAAIDIQGRLVTLAPEDPTRLQDRAWLAFQAGRHPDALVDLEKASALIDDERASADLQRQLEHVRRWIRAAR